MSPRFSAVLLTALLSVPAVGQSAQRYVIPGPPIGPPSPLSPTGFGSEPGTSTVGDVNGDGLADLAISMPHAQTVYPTPAGPNIGRVMLFSGVGGAFLRDLVNTQTGELFGRSLDGVGDWNGDGLADVAVGAEGSVQVFSGADGSLLQLFVSSSAYFGTAVHAAGDVDGDGVGDLAVGDYWSTGSVFIYSHDGSLLRQIDGTASNQHLGRFVSTAGDVDGDGLADVLASSDTGGHGTVDTYSGFDGSILRTYHRTSNTLNVVDGGDDLDGDGVPDFIVAEGTQGGTTAVSGATGLPLQTTAGTGVVGALVGDVDGDGLGDYLASGPGGVRLVSGNGTILESLPSAFVVTGGEDFDGDGRPDFALLHQNLNVQVWTGWAATPFTPYCPGDGTGALPSWPSSTPPRLCPCPGTSLVFREAFLGGVLPPGWTTTSPDWHVTSDCGFPGLQCHAPYLYNGSASCGAGDPGSVSTPWIPLPAGARKLTLQYCLGLRICSKVHSFHLSVATQSGIAFGYTWFSGTGYVPTTLDLTELAGETVRLTWTLHHDYLFLLPLPHGAWIDDVVIFASSGPGDAGEGCRNSTGEGGVLYANGSTSTAADDLQLVAAQVPPGHSGLFVVGDTTYTPPIAVGDGLVCTGGSSHRYPGTSTDAGVATLVQPVAGALGLIQPGFSYGFQFWHRDVAGGQCAGLSNLTPGVLITFTP